MKELLEPAFQPVVDLVSGEVAYYEALARIRGDATDLGHVTLIELAERCQFIHLLDLTILGQAIDAGVPEGQRIAVNFSAVTIERHFHQVVAHLATLGVGCRDLVVEITETAPIRDRRKVAVFIGAARELGCKVALDDFGNGAGHFTPVLVQFLRPDFLKLDGSILANAVRSGDHRELHEALSLAQSVNAEVIAEYVDSEEKIALLTRIGVRYGQGWALGRPTRGAFSPVNELVAETAGS
jgi:EAL domain-containing protein (putative c-di-GMP-specific phosphodiesterase class I)